MQSRLLRQVLDRQIGRARAVRAFDAFQVQVALLVEVADHELGEAPLVVGEIAELELPEQVVLQIAAAW